MCYAKQYSASFNKIMNWLNIFSHYFENILLYVKFHIIFFLQYIISTKRLVDHKKGGAHRVLPPMDPPLVCLSF